MVQQNLLILIRAEEPGMIEGWQRAFGGRIEVEVLVPRVWALTITAGVL